jgi:Domain of unknown function (DUF4372)/Transposase DDE domain
MENAVYSGKLIFAQVMEHLPLHTFRRCVVRYRGHHKVKQFTCLEQYLCMAFAQLTDRESLRDIETCLRAQQAKLYHMGIRNRVARSTLADANGQRDWRIYADFAQALIRIARPLYSQDAFGVDLEETVYALDSTTIDLCLSLFPWARYMTTTGAIKLHTLLDLRGPIPAFIHISDGKMSDVGVLDQLLPDPGAIYVMDRGYLDFARLYRLNRGAAFFLIRDRSNTRFRRLYSHAIDKSNGLRCDQTIVLAGVLSPDDYPDKLRRIKYYDATQDRTFTFLTNHFTLPAQSIADLYRSRWQVELFFKWIKQHLRIQSFLGHSDNAVRTQIWIAISVYVLIAIIKKRLALDASLYTILQILSVTLFERLPLKQTLTSVALSAPSPNNSNQLNLFKETSGQ